MSAEITALEFITQITTTVDDEISHCEKMKNKLLEEAMIETHRHCSGDLEKDFEKRIKDLSLKYEKTKENTIENKKMFLESIGLMGLMGLTNDEKWDFIKSSSLDLLSSIVSVEEKLFEEYACIVDDFCRIVFKSNY